LANGAFGEVSLSVARQVESPHNAHLLVFVIQDAQKDRHVGRRGNAIKTALPGISQSTCPLWRQTEVEAFFLRKHCYRLFDGRSGPRSVQRNATEASQQCAERKPEQRVLGKKPDIKADRGLEGQRPKAIPVRRVRRGDENSLGFIQNPADSLPSA